MDSMDLIDFILEFETERDLFVEGLFCLFVIFHKHLLVVLKVVVLLSQLLEFLEYFGIFLLVNVLIVINYLLPSLDLPPQHLHFCHLVSLDLSNHCLKVSIRAVLKQNSEDLPEGLSDCFAPHLSQQLIKTDGVNKQGSEYSVET